MEYRVETSVENRMSGRAFKIHCANGKNGVFAEIGKKRLGIYLLWGAFLTICLVKYFLISVILHPIPITRDSRVEEEYYLSTLLSTFTLP